MSDRLCRMFLSHARLLSRRLQRLAIVVPRFVRRVLIAGKALGAGPFDAAARTHRPGPEGIPGSAARRQAIPAVLGLWSPFALGAIDFNFFHGSSQPAPPLSRAGSLDGLQSNHFGAPQVIAQAAPPLPANERRIDHTQHHGEISQTRLPVTAGWFRRHMHHRGTVPVSSWHSGRFAPGFGPRPYRANPQEDA